MPTDRALRLAAVAAVTGVIGVASADASDGSRRYRAAPLDRDGYVVAESRFGHGTVSGPVRLARAGYEVRLPGGTWIACRRSCAETLRVESVDFWENKGAGRNAIDNECGLFGCLSRGFRF